MFKDTCLQLRVARSLQKLDLAGSRTDHLLIDIPKKHTRKLLRTIHKIVLKLGKNPIKRFYMSLQEFERENHPNQSYEQKVISF
jgi:hypothetical protein